MSGEVNVDVTHKQRYTEEQVLNTNDPIPGRSGNARVRAEVGSTLGLPNYSSLRITASVELPCEAADVQLAFDEAWSIASTQVANVTTRIKTGEIQIPDISPARPAVPPPPPPPPRSY